MLKKNKPVKKISDPIFVIVILCVIFYLITHQLPGYEEAMTNWFALYFPENPNFKSWQFLTTMFMHGDFVHLALNMYALWAFGTPLRELWGAKRFLIFYFASGLGASFIYTAVNLFRFNNFKEKLQGAGASPEDINRILSLRFDTQSLNNFTAEQLLDFHQTYHIPAVGASGAIYGILVAFGMMFPNAKLALIFLPVPIAAKYFIPVLVAIDLFSGVTGFSIFGHGIAHFAHVGGAVVGFALMMIWRKRYTVMNNEPFV